MTDVERVRLKLDRQQDGSYWIGVCVFEASVSIHVGARFWSIMEEIGRRGEDVVMMSKADLFLILEAPQNEDFSGVIIRGCAGNLLRENVSPFDRANVGKRVTFG